jgi:hypothetical protein
LISHINSNNYEIFVQHSDLGIRSNFQSFESSIDQEIETNTNRARPKSSTTYKRSQTQNHDGEKAEVKLKQIEKIIMNNSTTSKNENTDQASDEFDAQHPRPSSKAVPNPNTRPTSELGHSLKIPKSTSS